jgi:lipoprotein-anchoring transpeptidase ErfK/SrfK
MKKIYGILITILVVAFVFSSASSTLASNNYSIVVNKSYHLLFVKDGSKIIKTIPVTIGKGGDSETPVGTFAIKSIVHNPNWYFNGKVYPPYNQSPENGLGVCWMGISLPSYGIHGTNEPFSPGRNRSHGCVRMNNNDIRFLSSISFIGETVKIENGKNDAIAAHLKAINLLYDIENFLGGEG